VRHDSSDQIHIDSSQVPTIIRLSLRQFRIFICSRLEGTQTASTLYKLRKSKVFDLRKCCTRFAEAFSDDNSADVDLNDFISELQVLQVTLSDGLMLVHEILPFITVIDCYPNVSIAYRI
jgi:hypothetical protein